MVCFSAFSPPLTRAVQQRSAARGRCSAAARWRVTHTFHVLQQNIIDARHAARYDRHHFEFAHDYTMPLLYYAYVAAALRHLRYYAATLLRYFAAAVFSFSLPLFADAAAADDCRYATLRSC